MREQPVGGAVRTHTKFIKFSVLYVVRGAPNNYNSNIKDH